MKLRSVISFASAGAIALSIALVAHAKLSGIGESGVAFRAIGPAGLKIDGSIPDGLKASEAGGKVKLEAKLTNIKTGIGLRDKHTKKAINADRHSTASMVVERSALKFPDDKKSVKSGAKGKMTINGVTKPVSFKYEAKRTGSDYHVRGGTEIKYTDFGIEEQCYLGVCVDPKVEIKVHFKVREK